MLELNIKHFGQYLWTQLIFSAIIVSPLARHERPIHNNIELNPEKAQLGRVLWNTYIS